METFVLTTLCWSFLFFTVSVASRRTLVHDKCRTTKGNPQENKCSTVINGNYYAGTNEEMKTILQGIQAQLTDLREILRDMKTEKENKTGKNLTRIFSVY